MQEGGGVVVPHKIEDSFALMANSKSFNTQRSSTESIQNCNWWNINYGFKSNAPFLATKVCCPPSSLISYTRQFQVPNTNLSSGFRFKVTKPNPRFQAETRVSQCSSCREKEPWI